MIFEVDYSVIKKNLMIIKNILTNTEWNKSEFTNIQIHVKDEHVFISYKGEEKTQLEYQFDLVGAETIINGSIQINLKELLEALTPFNKNSGVLLFERDGNELRIDDGVYEPEIITLSEKNELKEIFSVARPKKHVNLSKKWFEKRMDLARMNIKTTFLPATNQIALLIQDCGISLRSFNLTNLYESKKRIEHSIPELTFLIEKQASARIARLLKAIKDEEIKLLANNDSLYLFTDEFVFCFDADNNEESKLIYESLPTKKIAKGDSGIFVKTSELKKLTKVKRGEAPPESVFVEWDKELINVSYSINDSKIYHYPFRIIQKVVSKWMQNMIVERGTEENHFPLIIKSNTDNEEDMFVIMRIGDEMEERSHNKKEEKIA